METWVCQDCNKGWTRRSGDPIECPECGSKDTKCVDIAF